MHRSRAHVALLSLLLGCASPTLASAQDMYPGQDVTVNSGANGSGVLLYPGGKYGRVVGPLLQPGDPYPGMPEKPIHLHMPYRHVAKHVKPKPPTAVASAASSAPPPQQQAAPPAPATDDLPPSDTAANLASEAPVAAPAPPKAAPPKAAPPPAPVRQAASKPPKPKPPVMTAAASPPPAPAPSPSSGGIPLSLGEEPMQSPAAPPPAPPHPTKVAKAEPPPFQTVAPSARAQDEGAGAGLTKQSQIIFASGIADPAPSSIDAIKGLSTPLNSALAAGATRVQVVAYGGARGDKSSDARRLSLKRALIIRQLLIDGGVPAGSIDVRAMGGASDSEPADRVDIFTKV